MAFVLQYRTADMDMNMNRIPQLQLRSETNPLPAIEIARLLCGIIEETLLRLLFLPGIRADDIIILGYDYSRPGTTPFSCLPDSNGTPPSRHNCACYNTAGTAVLGTATPKGNRQLCPRLHRQEFCAGNSTLYQRIRPAAATATFSRRPPLLRVALAAR